jgi:hypothetical protein
VANFHRRGFSRDRLVAVVEFDDPTNGVNGNMGVVFRNLLDIASAFEILHNYLRLDARALDDGLTSHLAVNALHEVAVVPHGIAHFRILPYIFAQLKRLLEPR